MANNATDTSFKAKTIAMPQQSILLDRSQSVTTRRKQTIPDLVQNTRHHAPGVRKDALLGMLELTQTYGDMMEVHGTTLIHSVLPLIGDEDVHVRATVARFLAAALEQMPARTFMPLASPMLLLTTSAMSHIMMPVRIDALRILDLLLSNAGTLATQGWADALETGTSADRHGKRILEAFFAMLGVAAHAQRAKGALASKSTAVSVELPPSERLRILRALRRFLQVATHVADDHANVGSLPTWCFQSTFASPSDREHFEQIFETNYVWTSPWLKAEIPGVSAQLICEALLTGLPGEHTTSDAAGSAYERLARVLHASILATLLDSLPAALAPDGSSASVHMDLVMEVLDTALIVWRHSVTSYLTASAARGAYVAFASVGQLQQLLTHLSPHFPVSTERRTSLETQARQRLNIVYCELAALATVSTTRRDAMTYLSPTLAYLISILQEDAATSMSVDMYEALLPTFWLLLSTPMNGRTELMQALLDHAQTRCAPSLQPVAFRFLARWALLPMYHSLQIDMSAMYNETDVQAAWHAWLLSLPRMVWNAATRSISTKLAPTEVEAAQVWLRHILQVLCFVFTQTHHPLFAAETLDMLGPQLQPLFTVEHPTKGRRPGPYHKLPDALQRQAQALAYRIPLALDDA